jgi:thiol-disulfide isomerase/thioredoxin
VPPGTYDLRLQFTEADENGNRYGPPLGSLNREVVVPNEPSVSLDAPFDVGELKLQVRFQLKVGDDAPPFEVKTLDDQPLRLSDYQGKYVLLDFWAVWCAPCRAELPHLKATHKEFGKHEKFALISLSLDADRKVPLDYATKEEMTWVQGFLGEWSKAELPGTYGVFGIPATFLIGPDGKVLARGLRGPAILEAVKEALGK